MLDQKNPYAQHEFLALNTFLSYLSKKSDAKIYIYSPSLLRKGKKPMGIKNICIRNLQYL